MTVGRIWALAVLWALMVAGLALVGGGRVVTADEPTAANGVEFTLPVDYVILVASGLERSAYDFAAHRRDYGHAVKIVRWASFAEAADPRAAARSAVHAAFGTPIGRAGSEGVALGDGHGFGPRASPVVRPLVNGLNYLLLLGDAPDGGMSVSKPPESFTFDAARIPTEIHSTLKDASPKPIPVAGDHWWSLRPDQASGGDATPVAVGRIPARTPAEAKIALDKTQRHERAAAGDWQRRLEFFAGEGRFGQIDLLLERMFADFADRVVDGRFSLRMTYANPRSAWAGVPSEMTEDMAFALKDGRLVTTYIGHGHVNSFDSMRIKNADGKDVRISIGTQAALVDLLKEHGQTPGLMLIIACQTGCFDHPKGHSIGEALLYSPGGPAAVLAGSRDTHPYANAHVQKQFLSIISDASSGDAPTLSVFPEGSPAQVALRFPPWTRARTLTIGAAHRSVKDLLNDPMADPYSAGVERLSSMLLPDPVRKRIRDGHLWLYNIIGDPAMRINRPLAPWPVEGGDAIKLKADKVAVGGQAEVEITPPQGAKLSSVSLTLVRLPSDVGAKPVEVNWAALVGDDPQAAAAENQKVKANHESANNKVVTTHLEGSPSADSGTAPIHRILDRVAPGRYRILATIRLSVDPLLDTKGSRTKRFEFTHSLDLEVVAPPEPPSTTD